jgi:gliding motility-associated-like protein
VVNPLPQVSFAGDTLVGCSPVCVNFSDLTVISTGSIAQWNWNFGDGTISTTQNPVHCYTNPTFNTMTFDVTLSVVSSAGCSSTQTVPNMVTVFGIPDAEFTFGPQPATIMFPEIEFTNLSAGASTYLWTFDIYGTSTQTDPVFTFPDDTSGNYLVCLTATSSNGCVDTICHLVIIDEVFSLYVPNAFTPDGDGTNDIFYPVIKGYNPEYFDLMIFNRWGELIYQTDNAANGWDGTHKGTKAKSDVYVWKIKARDTKYNERKSFYGHVSLLR